MTELMYRDMLVRETNQSARTITGIAVPYGETVDADGYPERFERGRHGPVQDAVLYAAHGHSSGRLPVGRITDHWDSDEGYWIRAQISETPAGDEVHTLLRDGVIKHMSVGFVPGESRQDPDGATVYTSSEFAEISVTPHPAYQRAQVTQVRHQPREAEGNEMPETQVDPAEVAQLRDTVNTQTETTTELERRMSVLEDQDHEPAPAVRYRSGGALLKALARGDEAAKLELRAADTTPPATSSQAGANFGGSGWIDRPLRFMTERRKIIRVFDQGPLPEAGNTVEWPRVDSTAGTVAQQAAEGDTLNYLEVELVPGNASVGTFGGYSSLSRQSIERSDESYLDAVMRYQAIQYGIATNGQARSTLTGTTWNLSQTLGAALASSTAANWIGTVVDSALAIENNSLGLNADVIIVASDVFKHLATLTDSTNRPIFTVNADGMNTIGDADPVAVTFNIAGLPGFVDPGLSAGACYIASRGAFTTLESPGAPFRINDLDVTNLTRQFALYGYAAWTLNDLNGVVTVDTSQ